MPTQKQLITIFGILGVVAFGLGYWDGMPEKDSGQRAEVVAPTIITNVVREVVTNIVTANPQPAAAQTPVKRLQPKPRPQPNLPPPEVGDQVGQIASYDPKFKYCVINRGANHGIKTGDEYNVIRGGNLVGKIKIQQTQPSVSIADAVYAVQIMRAGDLVIKIN